MDDIEPLDGGAIVYLWGESSDKGRSAGKWLFGRRSIYPRDEFRVRAFAPAGWSLRQEPRWGAELADASGRGLSAGMVFEMARKREDGFALLDWADGDGNAIDDIDAAEDGMESPWAAAAALMRRSRHLLPSPDPAASLTLHAEPRGAARLGFVGLFTGEHLYMGLTRHRIGRPWTDVTSWADFRFEVSEAPGPDERDNAEAAMN